MSKVNGRGPDINELIHLAERGRQIFQERTGQGNSRIHKGENGGPVLDLPVTEYSGRDVKIEPPVLSPEKNKDEDKVSTKKLASYSFRKKFSEKFHGKDVFGNRNKIAEIENQKNIISGLEQKIKSLDQAIQEMINNAVTVSVDLKPRTSEEVSTEADKYLKLYREKEALEAELGIAKARVTELEIHLDGKKVAEEELQLENAKNKSEIERLKGEINTLTEGLENVNQKNLELSRSIQDNKNIYILQKFSLDKKIRKLAIDTDEVERLKKQLVALEEQRMALFNSQRESLSDLSEKNDDLVGQNRRLSTELDQEKSFLAQAQIKIKELLVELGALKDESSDLEEENNVEKIIGEESSSWSQFELEKIQESLSWLEFDGGKKQEVLDSLADILKLKKEELLRKETNILSQKRIIDNLKSELKTTETQLESEKAKVLDYKNLTQQLQTELNKLNETFELAQKRQSDAIAGLASTFASVKERHKKEKEISVEENAKLKEKLSFFRERTRDLVSRTKGASEERKKSQAESDATREIFRRQQERQKDEKERAEAEELERNRKTKYKEKISTAKSTVELFDLTKEFLEIDGEAKELNEVICDCLYKNDVLKDERLVGLGLDKKLFLLRSEYLKGLEKAAKANSWIEAHKYFVEEIEPKMLKYPDDKENSLVNAFNEVISEMEKYIPENLYHEFQRLKQEDVEKNKATVSYKELLQILEKSENSKKLRIKGWQRDKEGFIKVVVGSFVPDLINKGKKYISFGGKEYKLENSKDVETFAHNLYKI